MLKVKDTIFGERFTRYLVASLLKITITWMGSVPDGVEEFHVNVPDAGA